MSVGFIRYLSMVRAELAALADADRLRSIDVAATLMVDAIAAGRVIYEFGASHAGLLVQDQFYRAGGLAPVQPILPRELMLDVRPVLATSEAEQTLGRGPSYLSEYPISTGDILIVVSVSGRNSVPVELAMTAQQAGATVIALTSVAYSAAVRGRGVPRLMEVADVVVDLGGVVGDAIIPLGEGLPAVGPTSSVVGAAILHGLGVEVTQRLIRRGIRPPVYASANLDDSADWNAQLIEEYRDRVDYLG